MGGGVKEGKEGRRRGELVRVEEVKMVGERGWEKGVVRWGGVLWWVRGLGMREMMGVEWEKMMKGGDGGWCMEMVRKKRGREGILGVCDEGVGVCGEGWRGEVLKGMREGLVGLYVKDWIKWGGIRKEMRFDWLGDRYGRVEVGGGREV